MIMGSVAAANIYALLLTEEDPSQPLVMERCPQHQPKIALSIGTNVVIYDGSGIGIQHGKDLAELSFGSDLGYSRRSSPHTSDFLSATLSFYIRSSECSWARRVRRIDTS